MTKLNDKAYYWIAKAELYRNPSPKQHGKAIAGGINVNWSRHNRIPSLGEEVTVAMNGLGKGIVKGYFVEDSFLGMHVLLSNPPAWWVSQQAKTDQAIRQGAAMVFGSEIDLA